MFRRRGYSVDIRRTLSLSSALPYTPGRLRAAATRCKFIDHVRSAPAPRARITASRRSHHERARQSLAKFKTSDRWHISGKSEAAARQPRRQGAARVWSANRRFKSSALRRTARSFPEGSLPARGRRRTSSRDKDSRQPFESGSRGGRSQRSKAACARQARATSRTKAWSSPLNKHSEAALGERRPRRRDGPPQQNERSQGARRGARRRRAARARRRGVERGPGR